MRRGVPGEVLREEKANETDVGFQRGDARREMEWRKFERVWGGKSRVWGGRGLVEVEVEVEGGREKKSEKRGKKL
jgi:hypothetical protein